MSIVRYSLIFVVFLLVSCGDSNRYEISKDGTGRTVRLDKKTGEIAIITDNQIQVLKSLKELAEEEEKQKELAKPKSWDGVDNPNLKVRFNLRTSWRDGEMYYSFAVNHLGYRDALVNLIVAKTDDEKKKAKEKLATFTKDRISSDLTSALRHLPFTLQLYDDNGIKLREIIMSKFTRIVDEKGFVSSYESESSVRISAELYAQLKSFSVSWSRR